jgi:Delta24-sterol reductase
VRPLQGLYGVYKAWRGGDYLLPSTKKKAPSS